MDKQNMEPNVTVHISEDAVAKLVVNTVSGISGFYEMGTVGIKEKFAKKQGSKGVRVQIDDHIATIDLHIVVEYGCRIPEVAWQMQETVKKTVEEITGLTVAAVNIHVDAIHFPETSE